MEIHSETDAAEQRREHWKLLSNLKTTVEGLLSTNNPNVWSRYGGLQRLHKDMNNILSHGLKHEQVYYKQKDYWQFVWCLRLISPSLAHHVEQFSKLEPMLRSGVHGEGFKAERWLLHSLQSHFLSTQLRPLLAHSSNTRKYYNDEAFLLSEPHVTAMLQCLEAVEKNDPRLLALIDTVRIRELSQMKDPVPLGLLRSHSVYLLPPECPLGAVRRHNSDCSLRESYTASQINTESVAYSRSMESVGGASESGGGVLGVMVGVLGAQSGCGNGDVIAGVPQVCVIEPSGPTHTESIGPTHSEPECTDVDDGPEYLAIGNLGRRRRSSSSSHSSELPPAANHSVPAPPQPPRRNSFSDMQRGKGRSFRGHTRSLSDTGVTQKHKQESAAEVPNVKSYGPFSSQSSSSSSRSSLYMESNGECSAMNDGLFRKPSEGQSLISYLSEQDFGSCADLEKENAHFSISESLIAAIELMKCNMRKRAEEAEEDGDSDSEIQQLKQKIRLRRQQIRRSRLQPSCSQQDSGSPLSSHDSFHHSASGSGSGSAEEVEDFELRDGCEERSMLLANQSGLSLSLASLFSDADIKPSITPSRSFISSESVSPSVLQSNSAESVAMGLLRQFEGMQLPAASELDWLVPEHDAPQKLLPIPDSLPISPDDGEHADIYKLRIRVRGNLEWAPPRPQIIFNIHPAPKRKVVVAKQNYRCAGCGTRVDPDYIKRLRYCEYLGRYFCQCCHENAVAVVPGRVLRKWDFGKYYVSNFARDLLGKIAGDPLFNPNDINSALYKKVKALETVRVLRVQLFHMKNLFKTCRLAKEVLDGFDSVSCHLTEDLHLFSLNDLVSVRSGELAPKLRQLLVSGFAHVSSCMLCQAKGFVCEFCGNDKDIIFPFELNKCQRCEECNACYHRACFKSGRECPRCQRLAERREKMARKNMEEDEEDDGGGT
ncbi:run domain Beclin-1-interacting and cysteine-rich domain-containing protein isoform X2 [Hoplias malabaricus]|uniref:run domain Beclin-1-interacting and cysteine-rich domain-containing protein isoform X2 n=1 Tax=Hoplias malabaricus TaxID=27720 RepID=UPI0034629709